MRMSHTILLAVLRCHAKVTVLWCFQDSSLCVAYLLIITFTRFLLVVSYLQCMLILSTELNMNFDEYKKLYLYNEIVI